MSETLGLSKFRFSLAAAFVFMSLTATGLGFYVFAQRQFKAEQDSSQILVSCCNGEFFSEATGEQAPKWNWREVVSGRLHTPIDSAEIFVDPREVTNSHIEKLYALPHLTYLRLDFDAIGTSQIDFSQFTKLTELTVSRLKVTNSHMVSISKLNQLRSLTLRHCQISDSHLGLLTSLSLNKLNLTGNPDTSDKGLKVLRGMSDLQSLILIDTSVCGESLSAPGFPRNLRTLSLNETNLDDEACISICKTLVHLESLSAQRTLLTDEVIPAILSHPELKRLRVKGTLISEEGLEMLNQSELKVF